jgi:putative serine protease PepD
MKRTLIALAAASGVVLTACAGNGSLAGDGLETSPLAFPSASSTVPAASANGDVTEVVDRVLPAVVNVVTDAGEGTGFIVREDGIVVTNFHVVEGATSTIKVLTSDERPREYDATYIGGDADADLAVLDIEATGLPTLPLGDSDALRLGQPVVAVGYALGLAGGPSVTSGIVSSLSREITVEDPGCTQCSDPRRVYPDVIQTDAAINPGNSGGPLVDLAGNVVGINSAGTQQAENIGFAIQINAVRDTIFGAAANPGEPVAYLGIRGPVAVSDPQVQFQFDPPVDDGVLIQEVPSDGPAAAAGMLAGDIIVAFDGRAVADEDDLVSAIRSHDPGDRVEVEVVRGEGERLTLTVELGVNPAPVP